MKFTEYVEIIFLQIHTFTTACNRPWSPATCNCGAAIKSGDDVILFDRCDRDGLDVKIFLNGELTPGTHIFRVGQSYTVSYVAYVLEYFIV